MAGRTSQSLLGTEPGLWRLACALALLVVGGVGLVAALVAYSSYDLVCTPGVDDGCSALSNLALAIVQLLPLVAIGSVIRGIVLARKRQTLNRRLTTLAAWSTSMVALTVVLTAVLID